MTTLLDKSRVEILLGDYGSAPAAALTDPSLLPKVQEYRRMAGSRMQPLDREGMLTKIPASEFHASRKIDGEFTVLIYRDNQILTLNPGGTVRVGLPVLEEAEKLLRRSGVREAMFAAEFYVQRPDNSRSRIHDVVTVARKPQSTADVSSLCLAVFDTISKDESPVSQPFAETWKVIKQIFDSGTIIHPVEAKFVKTTADIQKLFETWVEKEGSEGLVVRSDDAGTFKIKPRHTLDLAVLGFAESIDERQGMLHDMLLGVKRPDNTLQVLGRVGGGFTDDQRRDMLSDLKDMAVDSEYAEVNSDNVAYQMVHPDWVVEISCLDLLSETTRGASVNRTVLDYRNNGTHGYHVVTKMPLATIISPQFIRRREDKHVRVEDCGIRQVSNLVNVADTERDARQMSLPVSEVLRREVYTKDLKGQTMVRKFLMWKSNKEMQSDEYPSYVLHYTDFSPGRKDPLARDIRVSNSRDQIDLLLETLKAENIKGGWNRFEAPPVPAKLPETPSAAEEPEPTPAKPQNVAEKQTEDTIAPAKKSRKKTTAEPEPVAIQPESTKPPKKKLSKAEATPVEVEAAPAKPAKKSRKKS